jgi:hypothetical protein
MGRTAAGVRGISLSNSDDLQFKKMVNPLARENASH